MGSGFSRFRPEIYMRARDAAKAAPCFGDDAEVMDDRSRRSERFKGAVLSSVPKDISGAGTHGRKLTQKALAVIWITQQSLSTPNMNGPPRRFSLRHRIFRTIGRTREPEDQPWAVLFNRATLARAYRETQPENLPAYRP